MAYPYFSRDGEVLPVEQASIPLSRVEYSYGFGVYENIRVGKGQPFFIDDHCQRLMASAEIIGLQHSFSLDNVKNYISELIQKNAVEACNIKALLIGGRTAADATLEILCLNPLFPDRKLYRTGAKVITYNYEREFPQAKTLNMLSSYMAYREAVQAGAYDALLVDRDGNIREGTRTNFFGLKDKTITSPPSDKILLGVTRHKILEVARQNGYEIVEKDVALSDIGQFDSLFITSTSSKIMPLKSLVDFEVEQPVHPNLLNLMRLFDDFMLRVQIA